MGGGGGPRPGQCCMEALPHMPEAHPAQWSTAAHWDPSLLSDPAEEELADPGSSTKVTSAPRHVSFDLVTPFLGIYPAVYLGHMCNENTNRLFTAGRTAIAGNRKQPKRPSAGGGGDSQASP